MLGYIVGTEKDKPESRVLMATYLLNEKKLRGKDYVTLEAVFGDLQDMNLVRKITHGCYVIKTALPVGELARQVWRLARRRRGDVFYVTQIQRPWAVRDQLGDLREWLIENV